MAPKKVKEEYLYIENLPTILVKVRELMVEKELNPGVVQEDEAGMVFIEGEPKMIIDNQYLPLEEAKIILQTRKIVREYLKLQDLITKKK